MLFWGPVWPNTVGSVSGQPGHWITKNAKCIMSTLAMWWHVPSLVRNKFYLATGEGLMGLRVWCCFGAPVWPNTVGLSFWITMNWITKRQVALCQPWPCDVMYAKSCKQTKFDLAKGERLIGLRVWCCFRAQFGQTQLGQFLDNQYFDHKTSSCIMSTLAMWCHVPILVRNKLDLAGGEGLIGSNKSLRRRSYI